MFAAERVAIRRQRALPLLADFENWIGIEQARLSRHPATRQQPHVQRDGGPDEQRDAEHVKGTNHRIEVRKT